MVNVEGLLKRAFGKTENKTSNPVAEAAFTLRVEIIDYLQRGNDRVVASGVISKTAPDGNTVVSCPAKRNTGTICRDPDDTQPISITIIDAGINVILPAVRGNQPKITRDNPDLCIPPVQTILTNLHDRLFIPQKAEK